MVSVAVLPLPPETEINISDKDLEIEAVNLGGKGGQHQNKTMSGCRMTHIPTGIKVVINGRDFHSNVKEAKRIIQGRVYEQEKEIADQEYAAFRKEQMQGGHRSGKIRTYNFLESRVVDHRLGVKTSNVKAVMKGEFKFFTPNV